MILSGHQPVYLPGVILFNKIALSDTFMFVGHCQLSNKSWHTRNRIRLGDREFMLSVPVKKEQGQSINETQILEDGWQKKHLGSIRQAYGKRPFFSEYFPQIEALLCTRWPSLGDMNISIIKSMLDWFDIKTPILDSREYHVTGNKTDMLISMCRAAGASQYLSNEGARDYVDEAAMAEAGILHSWQIFTHPTYNQNAAFMENMSAIDLLFNMGPEAGGLIRECGRIEPGAGRPTWAQEGVAGLRLEQAQ